MTESRSQVILILTNRSDYTADFLITKLIERDIAFFRFNTEDFPFQASLSLTPTSGTISLHRSNRTIRLSDIDSVWYRRPENPAIPRELDPGAVDFVNRESRDCLLGIWRCLDCRWVNHPDKIRLAENKIEQLNRMRRMGLTIPNTLISNDPKEATAFYRENSERVIAKTLRASHGSSEEGEYLIYTTAVEADQLKILDTVKYSPVIFQEKLTKQSDVRVTVVGSEVIATEIHSQEDPRTKIDWRRDTLNVKHTAHKLPGNVEDQCLKLIQSYGLLFGAIDLVRTHNDYVFLELNPNGQWAWIESLTGQPISNSLANLLSN